MKTRFCLLALILTLAASFQTLAQDVVCAGVRIEILQELTFEREAFEARMRITNGLASEVIVSDIEVDVDFRDAEGQPVGASRNPDANPEQFKFFIRLQDDMPFSWSSGGAIAPATVPGGQNLTIKWLIIPSSTAGGELPQGVQYFVGATLRYKVNGQSETVRVNPDYIFVKPMPLLKLDYFLPKYVNGDDPFTLQIEPVEPFSLGVRATNQGFGTAKNLKIDSGQPRIVDNRQGLLVNFVINGSEVNGRPAQPTLLANFGDLPAGEVGTARWIMSSSLYGSFTEFTAEFSHADELGGLLTSLIQPPIKTYLLLRDVLVDLPGRDQVRDFLAFESQTGNSLAIFESGGFDFPVTDLSGALVTSGTGDVRVWTLPPNLDFFYARSADPTGGQKVVVRAIRGDGKLLPLANVWQHKIYDPDARRYDFYLNLFDASNPQGHSYEIQFSDAPLGNRPPEFQSLADRMVPLGAAVSMLVTATDPDGDVPVVTPRNLPAGAQFALQSSGTGIATYLFEWNPAGPVGTYPLEFEASDGVFTVSMMTNLTVLVGLGYDLWKDQHGITDDFADHAYDGIPNALKYALDLHPRRFNRGAILIEVQDFEVEGEPRAHTTLTYIRRDEDLGFELVVESGSSSKAEYADWAPVSSHEPHPDQSGVAPGMVRMLAIDPTPLHDGVRSRVIRLRPVFAEEED